MQYPHIPVRAVKVHRLEGGGIGPRTERYIIWDGLIAMVPCMHQGNIDTKRKLHVWREQICIQQLGAIPHLPVRAIKITRLEEGVIAPRMESCVICDGPIDMVPCLHQGNLYTKTRVRVWREQICIKQVGAIPQLTCGGR